MHFQPFYLGCLAHGSYLIGSDGEAAVVDPQRDVDQYLEEAERRGLAIRYILETHFHADFVSGHVELARRTGATIVFGRRAETAINHLAVLDGDKLRLGKLTLTALETPGHTPESITWTVTDPERSSEPVIAFTGDTLFINDAGRPDLVGSKGFTPEEMASMMYDSLRTRILTLPDSIEIWPAHGAGSACGRNISDARSSTLGEQKRSNWALQPMSREEFVTLLTENLEAPPSYFPLNAEMNRRGPQPLRTDARALDHEQVQALIEQGALIVDVRPAEEFRKAHVAGSINIGLAGDFAPWAGSLLPFDSRIVIVAADEQRVEEAVIRLGRVGIEGVEGYLRGGIEAWRRAGLTLASSEMIDPRALHLAASEYAVLDVRRRAEFVTGHVPGAINIPLTELSRRIEEVQGEKPVAVICAGGYRSAMAVSFLERAGKRRVSDVTGGTAAWKTAGLPLQMEA